MISDSERDAARTELQQLITGLETATETRRRSRSKRFNTYVEYRQEKRKSSALFWFSAVLLLAGFGALVLAAAMLPSKEELLAEEAAATPAISEKELSQVHQASTINESRFPSSASAAVEAIPAPDISGEKQHLLETFAIAGGMPQFFAPEKLPIPAEDKPLRVYCMLANPLDSVIEDIWEKEGLLDEENELVNPCLRFVVLKNENSLNKLKLAAVEGVTYDLNPGPDPATSAETATSPSLSP